VDTIRKNLQAVAECESSAAKLLASRQAAQAQVMSLALDLRHAKQDAENARAEVHLLQTRLAHTQQEAAEASQRVLPLHFPATSAVLLSNLATGQLGDYLSHKC
jgi:chromosome segregation ATPase